MQNSHYADLDELVLLCRSNEAKSYIAESVACYRAGAFRACIVSTWIAVVFDFIDKLRQLDLAGDSNAQQQIEKFELLIRNHDLKGSLEFENTLLDKAKDDFELISQVEYDELQRLYADRHRCAHPSMRTIGEPYQPTAEAARYHLRNAILYLLQYPPVQGKAALDRLISMVESPYFPTVHSDAMKYFGRGPLQRPRETLVRNFAVVILKKLFLDRPNDYLQMLRYVAGLEALLHMHHNFVEITLKEKLSEIVRRVPDSQLSNAIEVLYNLGILWDFFEDDLQLRFQNYVQLMPEAEIDNTLWFALNIPRLRKSAFVVVDQLNLPQFGDLIRDFTTDYDTPPEKLVDMAVTFYTESTSWQDTNFRSTMLLIPVVPFLRSDHVKQVFAAMVTNYEIYGSNELDNVLKAIKEADGKGYSGFASLYDDLCVKADERYGPKNRFRSLHLNETPSTDTGISE
ncbi:MAG: hypothetical protein IAE83_22030 [Anaerolinea sp.]|nr:hypothetical protein [Anaerolinea sp.]